MKKLILSEIIITLIIISAYLFGFKILKDYNTAVTIALLVSLFCVLVSISFTAFLSSFDLKILLLYASSITAFCATTFTVLAAVVSLINFIIGVGLIIFALFTTTISCNDLKIKKTEAIISTITQISVIWIIFYIIQLKFSY